MTETPFVVIAIVLFGWGVAVGMYAIWRIVRWAHR